MMVGHSRDQGVAREYEMPTICASARAATRRGTSRLAGVGQWGEVRHAGALAARGRMPTSSGSYVTYPRPNSMSVDVPTINMAGASPTSCAPLAARVKRARLAGRRPLDPRTG
jgi:hypothetical protein